MISEVSICKEALALIGQESNMISLDDESIQARLCNQFYEVERNRLLRLHPWSFALKQQEFPLSAEAPVYEYSNAFRLPADCLRFVRPWVLETSFLKVGPYIYTNESSFFGLYVQLVENPQDFDPLFTEVLAVLIAQKICLPLNSSRSMLETLSLMYKQLMARAKSVNAFETANGATQTDFYASSFLQARRWSR